MSFEREVVEIEIARLEREKATLLELQREHSAAAKVKHQADHNQAIAALTSARDKASEKARAVLQQRIVELTVARDTFEVKDFGPRIAELSQTIGQLKDLLELLN